MDVMLSIDDLV